MSSDDRGNNDNQYALDLAFAMEVQAQEAQRALQEQEQNNYNYGATKGAIGAGHMLFIICEIEGKAVEMLVDSGASCSAISLKMVHQLGLSKHLNPYVRGQASGVGAANIVGLLENTICTIGHVEFTLSLFVWNPTTLG